MPNIALSLDPELVQALVFMMNAMAAYLVIRVIGFVATSVVEILRFRELKNQSHTVMKFLDKIKAQDANPTDFGAPN